MARPEMDDPADKDLHTKTGRDPYPPAKAGAKTDDNGATDLDDPQDADPDAPHDHGTVQDGKYKRAPQDMNEKIGSDAEHKAWEKGKTQNG